MEVIIDGRCYLQHRLRQSVRVKIPVKPTAEQLAVSVRRLDWLFEHNNLPYPVDLAVEIPKHKLWDPNNKCDLPIHQPPVQATIDRAEHSGSLPVEEPDGLESKKQGRDENLKHIRAWNEEPATHRAKRLLEASKMLSTLITEEWAGVEVAARLPNVILKQLSENLCSELRNRYVNTQYLMYSPVLIKR